MRRRVVSALHSARSLPGVVGRSAGRRRYGEHCAAADRAALQGWSDIEFVNYLLTGNMVRRLRAGAGHLALAMVAVFAPLPPLLRWKGLRLAGRVRRASPSNWFRVPSLSWVIKPAGAGGGCRGAAAPAPGAAPAASGAVPADAAALARGSARDARGRFSIARSASRFNDGVIEHGCSTKCVHQLKAADISRAVAQVAAIQPKAQSRVPDLNSVFDGRFCQREAGCKELPRSDHQIVWDAHHFGGGRLFWCRVE